MDALDCSRKDGNEEGEQESDCSPSDKCNEYCINISAAVEVSRVVRVGNALLFNTMLKSRRCSRA